MSISFIETGRLSMLLASAVVCLGIVLGGEGGAAPANAKGGSFCADRLVVDYEAPLKRMRPTNRLPVSGMLPFGPGEPYIALLGLGRIAVDGGAVGFRVGIGLGPRPGRPLGWRVKTRLSEVDARGHILHVSRQRERYVERVRGLENLQPWFEVGARPATYRVDIGFRDKSGRRMAHYAEYFLVLPSRLEVRLGIDQPSVKRGQRVQLRLENVGTAGLTYGYPFRVEQLVDDSWVAADFFRGAWPLPALFLGPGAASECQAIDIPADVEPGRYRIVKPVETQDRRGDEIELLAEFEIIP